MTTTTYTMGTCAFCGRWALSCPLGSEQTGEAHLCERCTLALTDDAGRRIAKTHRTTGRVVLIDPDREDHDAMPCVRCGGRSDGTVYDAAADVDCPACEACSLGYALDPWGDR